MAKQQDVRQELIAAIDMALDGKWEDAHGIVQSHGRDIHARWIHAVLHRIEGDETNATYWYVRAGKSAQEGTSTEDELRVIRDQIADSL